MREATTVARVPELPEILSANRRVGLTRFSLISCVVEPARLRFGSASSPGLTVIAFPLLSIVVKLAVAMRSRSPDAQDGS
jgi:hypothetical protein